MITLIILAKQLKGSVNNIYIYIRQGSRRTHEISPVACKLTGILDVRISRSHRGRIEIVYRLASYTHSRKIIFKAYRRWCNDFLILPARFFAETCSLSLSLSTSMRTYSSKEKIIDSELSTLLEGYTDHLYIIPPSSRCLRCTAWHAVQYILKTITVISVFFVPRWHSTRPSNLTKKRWLMTNNPSVQWSCGLTDWNFARKSFVIIQRWTSNSRRHSSAWLINTKNQPFSI